jgi:hypothetical protein
MKKRKNAKSKKNRYGGVFLLYSTGIVIISGLIIYVVSNLSLGTVTGWTFSVLLYVYVLFGISFLLGIKKIGTGKTMTVKTLGGTLLRVIVGDSPEHIGNDPNSVNYDERYKDWEGHRIEKFKINGIDIRGWGPPFYSLATNQVLAEDDIQEYVDDRSFLLKHTGLEFIGFFPFAIPVTWEYPGKTRHVSTAKIMRKITQDEKDIDEYPEYSIIWTNYNNTDALIYLNEHSTRLPLFLNMEIVARDLETGGKNPTSGNNEMFNIVLFTSGQIQLLNPAAMFSRGGDVKQNILDAHRAAIRRFVAELSIEELQSQDHNAPGSKYRENMERISFDQIDPVTKTVTEKGTLSTFGFYFPSDFRFLDIAPGDEATDLMFKADQGIALANKKIEENTKLGQANGALKAEELKAVTEAEKAYYKETGINPNEKIKYDGLSKVNTLVLNSGVSPVLPIGNNNQSNSSTP